MTKPEARNTLAAAITMICVIIILATCNNRSSKTSSASEAPIWIFNIHSTAADIKEVLDLKHYDYECVNEMMNGINFTVFAGERFVVDYLDMDWDGFMIGCINDTISIVSLSRLGHGGKNVHELDRTILELDHIYGEHRLDRTNESPFDGNLRQWHWTWGNINAKLSASSANIENDVITLEIFNGNEEDMERLILQATPEEQKEIVYID